MPQNSREILLNQENNIEKDQIIALMGVYLNEWIYRDNSFWNQIVKYFYLNIIVTTVPNIAGFLKIDFSNINPKLFPIVGIIMAIAFLYLNLSNLLRIQAINNTYINVMELLIEDKLKRISIEKDEKNKLFFSSNYKVMTWAMFFLQIFIAVVLLIYSDDVDPFISKM